MYKEASAVNLSRFQKGKLAGFLALSVFLLGAAGGALVWAFLKILGMGMEFFWETLPQHLGAGSWYNPFLCLTGGLAMGLFQQKFGILPDTMAEVIAKVKRDGTYDYHRRAAASFCRRFIGPGSRADRDHHLPVFRCKGSDPPYRLPGPCACAAGQPAWPRCIL